MSEPGLSAELQDSLEILQSERIADQVAIPESRGEVFFRRDQIKKFVEPALLDASEHFWDLNIQTLSSSANAKDIGGNGYIIIDFNSLSETNKVIARVVGVLYENYDGRPAIWISIPITADSTVEEIREKSSEIVHKFEKQQAAWVPTYTLRDLNQMYSGNPDEEGVSPADYEAEGWYYDPASELFYSSEEHFKKAQEKIE